MPKVNVDYVNAGKDGSDLYVSTGMSASGRRGKVGVGMTRAQGKGYKFTDNSVYGEVKMGQHTTAGFNASPKGRVINLTIKRVF